MELELLLKAKQGCRRSQDRIVRQYTGMVYKRVNRVYSVRNSHYFEDAVQEGLLAILKAITTWQPNAGSSFTSWVYVAIDYAVRYFCVKFFKNKQRNLCMSDEWRDGVLCIDPFGPDPDDSYLIDHVAAVLGGHFSEDFEILNQRAEGVSLRKLAKKYGVSEGRMQTRVIKIRDKLKRSLTN